MSAPSRVLDLADAEQECGDPALARVRRAWAELDPGAVLETRSPIAEHAFAVRAWVRREGGELVGEATIGNQAVLRVRKPG